MDLSRRPCEVDPEGAKYRWLVWVVRRSIRKTIRHVPRWEGARSSCFRRVNSVRPSDATTHLYETVLLRRVVDLMTQSVATRRNYVVELNHVVSQTDSRRVITLLTLGNWCTPWFGQLIVLSQDSGHFRISSFQSRPVASRLLVWKYRRLRALTGGDLVLDTSKNSDCGAYTLYDGLKTRHNDWR